jgi:SWI/SNF-related matrix-associated actin-dependent regulator of chromatin subfamily A3
MLEKSQIGCARLDGTMSREDRTEAMDRLKNDRKCEVLLVSLRAGGVGLNLVAASRCYLVDPYW